MDNKTARIEFTGCEYLDFAPRYGDCRRQALGNGELFWLRPHAGKFGDPSMVQFCKKRGRLNSPTACLQSKNACCGDYAEHKHVIDVPIAELD